MVCYNHLILNPKNMRDENGKFLGFYSPRYTQVPDELFDELLAELSGSETKVLLYVIRRTFGFKRESDHISLSQMVNGITKKDGTILDKGTGLHKDSVATAIKSLISKGILCCKSCRHQSGGFGPNEYSLNVIQNTLSDNPTRGVAGTFRQGIPEKSDTQEIIKQNIITLKNASRRPVRGTPVHNSSNEKQEYLANLILETCRDKQSIAFYRKAARLLPERAIHEALSQVKEAEQLGRIRERPGAMFTDIIKRKAIELGIKFSKENQDIDSQPEYSRELVEKSTPAELMMGGFNSRR